MIYVNNVVFIITVRCPELLRKWRESGPPPLRPSKRRPGPGGVHHGKSLGNGDDNGPPGMMYYCITLY